MKKARRKARAILIKRIKQIGMIASGAGFFSWATYNVILLIMDGTVYGGSYGYRRWLRYEVDGATFVAHAVMHIVVLAALAFVGLLYAVHFMKVVKARWL
ncbi:hypothetical protein ACVCNR_22460 (plasmid) [Aquamicrobium terrae]